MAKSNMDQDILKILLSEEEIKALTAEVSRICRRDMDLRR